MKNQKCHFSPEVLQKAIKILFAIKKLRYAGQSNKSDSDQFLRKFVPNITKHECDCIYDHRKDTEKEIVSAVFTNLDPIEIQYIFKAYREFLIFTAAALLTGACNHPTVNLSNPEKQKWLIESNVPNITEDEYKSVLDQRFLFI